ncbi:hypothetical protein NKI23_13625 [Mesorhizobium sp. M0809]
MPLAFDQHGAQMIVQAAALEVVLAGEVRVKGRSADVCLIADVLDGNCFISLSQDQSDQRMVKSRPGPGDTAVYRLKPTLQEAD